MAETEQQTETTETTTPTSAEQDHRIGALESKVDHLIDLMSKGTPEPGKTQPAETNLAHEIRSQLDQRDRQRAEADAARAGNDRLAALEQKVTGLTEQAPVAPVKRSTKWMWGS